MTPETVRRSLSLNTGRNGGWRHRCSHRVNEMFVTPHALVVLVCLSSPVGTGAVLAAESLSVEVFTVAGYPISGRGSAELEAATVAVYSVEGLAALESALSENLPTDSEAAKAEALRRIGGLNDAQVAQAKDAAMGLTQAVQYGVDRTPAIVIDGAVVIYGVTDLVDAVRRYEAWREGDLR